MNVLHSFKFYYPKSGGIQHAVRVTAEGLAKRGHDVRVLSSVVRGCGRTFEEGDVRVKKVGSLGTTLSVPIAPTYPVHLWRAKATADLLHYHLPDPLSVTSDLISGRSTSPTVITYHSDIVRQSSALQFYRPLLDRFLACVDRILVTSPGLLEHSEFLTDYADKCKIVPLGIDIDHYGSYDGPTYELPVDGDRPVLLFVGRLVYYKGLEYLIEAMQGIDADLLIAGSGPLRQTLEQQADNTDVSDQIHFLGYVESDLLHYCYEVADVFVFPSVARSEAFGVAQLEAMAYRTPVINTNLRTGVPWVSRNGETGLTVPPRDPDALQNAIRTLVGDECLRSEYGSNARSRVEQLFTKERQIKATCAVYEELV